MPRVRSEAGFTLLEIMVVVFILGLLVTLVAPNIITRAAQARRTKAGAEVKVIAQAVQLFKLDNGVYPSTGDGLEILTKPGRAPNANPDGYLPRVPVDPWGNQYAYFSDGHRFLVKSYGADGQEGGEGENADIASDES